MAEYLLSFPGGIRGRFKTACDIKDDKHIRQQFAAHAPGISFLDEPPSGNSSFLSLEHRQADNPNLVAKGLHATLYGPKDEAFPADLCHLLYGLERKALLQQELYPVHAACVGKDGEYMLLIGHSGAGKTTLAEKLVEQDGFKLFSGNKTVVRFDPDGMKAIAGTRTMTVVKKDFNRYAYDLRPSDYALEPEVKINSIAIVRVNDGVEECQTLNPVSALHTLYPYFLDTVNADVIVNGKDIFSGTVPLAVKKHLSENLGRSLQTVPVRKISGSMPYMTGKAIPP